MRAAMRVVLLCCFVSLSLSLPDRRPTLSSGDEWTTVLASIKNFSASTILEVPLPLDAPQIDRVMTDSVDLSWNSKSSRNTGFKVYLSTGCVQRLGEKICAPKLVEDRSFALETSVRIGGLTQNTKYAFRVAALNVVGEGPVSPATAEVNTLDLVEKPGFVLPPILKDYSDKSITIQWQAPWRTGGELEYYTVYYCGGPQDKNECPSYAENVVKVPTTESIAADLVPGTNYKFKVKAMNRAGDSVESLESNFVTKTRLPESPPVPEIKGTTYHSVAISWFAYQEADLKVTGGSAISKYTVFYVQGKCKEGGSCTFPNKFETKAPGCENIPGHIKTCVVDPLKPGSGFKFVVVATNSLGDSPQSTPSAEARTDYNLPGKPPKPMKGDDPTEYTLSIVLTAGYTGGYNALLGFKILVCMKSDCPVSELTTKDGPWQAVCNSPKRGGAPGIGKPGSPIEECLFPQVIPGPDLATAATWKLTLENLIPRQNYKVVVIAVNGMGESPPSEISDAITLKAAKPEAPIEPTCVSSSLTTIDLQWQVPSYDGGFPIKNYRIYICEATQYFVGQDMTKCSADGAPFIAAEGVNPFQSTSMQIANMKPNTKYTFKVAAINDKSEGYLSVPTADPGPGCGTPGEPNIIFGCCLTYMAPPMVPLEIKAPDTRIKENELRLQIKMGFDAVSTGGLDVAAMRYRVSMAEAANPFMLKAMADDMDTEPTVTGLKAGTVYRFKVKALNTFKGFESPWTDIISARTLTTTPPNPPQNVRVTLTTRDSIMLVWDAVKGEDLFGSPLTGYKVYMLQVKEDTCQTEGTPNPPPDDSMKWDPATLAYDGARMKGTNTVITNLNYCTQYGFRVSAVSENGEGLQGGVVTGFTTRT